MLKSTKQPADSAGLKSLFALAHEGGATAKLFFATVGSASDNTFYENGRPVRGLMAFASEDALQYEQNEIWTKSERQQNLIALPHQQAAAYGNRVLFASGVTLALSRYLELVGMNKEDLQLMDMLRESKEAKKLGQPLCVIRFKDHAYYAEAYKEARLLATESWSGNQ